MKMLSPHDIISAGLCIGCGSCASNAEQATSMGFDKYGQLKPKGKSLMLKTSSQRFNRICPFSPYASNEDELALQLFPGGTSDKSLGRYLNTYVGYASEDNFRMNGSSGGMVSWVASELLKRKMIDGVAHVVPVIDPQNEGKYFEYRISRTEKELSEGAKSRYYPVELSTVLKMIRENPGRYAVVGIPCFIKAVQLLRLEDPLYRDRIVFTLGLFCGHMKSARFIESFAWQMNVDPKKIRAVEYRYKNPSRPANWYTAQLTMNDGSVREKDWWHLSDGDWGAGFFMNSACNFCDDVVAETADISFGDAWVEPYSSDGKGTNVVVVRSPFISELIKNGIAAGRLQLDEVNAAFIQQTQAAGFRQRREGLKYRLSIAGRNIQLKKRVYNEDGPISPNRKLVYSLRQMISKWSHRMFFIARKIRTPKLYIWWSSMMLTLYHGLAYNRGKVGRVLSSIGLLGNK